MCGIIGYIGEKRAAPIILEGLKQLEYRGYDSAGIATINRPRTKTLVRGKNKLSVLKCKGRIADLESHLKKRMLFGKVGIGHTRWATHGAPSTKNAHPHSDYSGKIAVVHNGIIENYEELRNKLEKDGYRFKSYTDSEVIPNLISKLDKGDLKKAVIKAIKILKGSYALGIVSADEPEKILAVGKDSPLIIGLGKGENFIASDVPSILKHTKKVIYLQNKQLAVIEKDNVDISDLEGNKVSPKIDSISYSIEAAQKGGFRDFMLKEIYEQPAVISKILSQWVSTNGNIGFRDLTLSNDFLKGIEQITIVACGTAFHAGLVGKYVLESLARIPVWVDLASEFRYRKPIIKKNTLIIAISQSGETADTLAAVREAKKSKVHPVKSPPEQGARLKGEQFNGVNPVKSPDVTSGERAKPLFNRVKVISICNVLGSSLARESDSNLYTYAGPEISVASTKAYTAQLMTLYLFALYLAKLKQNLNKDELKKAISSLQKIAAAQKKILDKNKDIKRIARKHLHFGAFLYLGRGVNFPSALEGALKLKELSYIPAEGYAAGEMKHGPIALIDEYRAIVSIANDSPVYDKMLSNIQEGLARKGRIIAIATEGNKQIKNYLKEVIFIPKIENMFSPLLTIIPLQLLAYYVASLKGYDVDKPRNLAKSVTVE